MRWSASRRRSSNDAGGRVAALALAGTLVFLPAHVVPAPEKVVPPGTPRASEALKQIDHLIGTARCRDDSQCRVAGIGARACGGPETYRAWSTLHTDARALETWLQVHAQERQRWHEKVGLMSTCEVVPAPGARCALERGAVGHCVLDPTAAGQR